MLRQRKNKKTPYLRIQLGVSSNPLLRLKVSVALNCIILPLQRLLSRGTSNPQLQEHYAARSTGTK